MTEAERKFYRQVVQVEILSEDAPLEWDNLADIHYAITTGDCSGKLNELIAEEVDGRKMAELLIKQGSDPSFFRLDDEGRTIDEI